MSATRVEQVHPWINGRTGTASEWVTLRNPYDGTELASVARTDGPTVHEAVSSAVAAQRQIAQLPASARASILRTAADLVEQDARGFASTISVQTGKAVKNALREVRRGAWTLRAAATAAETLTGRTFTASAAPEGAGLLVLAVREPVGVIGAITPFNAPFNLVLHKVAPAFAAGNAVVVKPSEQAPLSALDVARLMERAGAPAGAVNVVPGGSETGAHLVDDERVRMLTFTGGRAAGEAIRRAAGLRKVTLELGGNSPNIVHHDADIEAAVKACVAGGFSNTGQSCNSVQRIIVHRDIVARFGARLVEGVADLRVGDPLDPDTDVGTLITAEAAERVQHWLHEAQRSGARVLGGERVNAQLSPAVVFGAPPSSRVVCEEVFGPVVVVQEYTTVDEAIELANSTRFGLQSAVFTASLDVAMRVMTGIESGAVLVNRSSNFRLDHLPYGGVKTSGVGREGPEFAAEEMTEVKLLVMAESVPS
ncbi:aldehyde dehydrogenase family protein [Mycolicibacterium sp.]|uniref:aldehyde dehydrogenase family protein n=1 Tax=Mycolicibacterium sp. TaxID=2320850 RepID=UPI003D103BF4